MMPFIQKAVSNKQVQHVISNKHTSGAGIAFVAVNVLSKLGEVWFPAYAQQFKETSGILEYAAITYGLVMVGYQPVEQTTEEPPTETKQPNP
jgi:hypothetical protein